MTTIEWTDETWNPVTGCRKISAGCKNCYAERMARRLAGRHGYPDAPDHFKVTLHESRLSDPLRWKKPRMVFVCSMSDLFHVDVSVEYIGRVFNVIGNAPDHTFQVLTKRPGRMYRVLSYYYEQFNGGKPFDNVWLMTTVENQKAADERIEWLLKSPAMVRGLSIEPLLGSVDLGLRNWPEHMRLDWVIVGGESGPGARPMDPSWVRLIQQDCEIAGVPFFFKQWGGVNKQKTGRLLDGKMYDELPVIRR